MITRKYFLPSKSSTVSGSMYVMPKFQYSFTFYCRLKAIISIFTVKNFPCNTLICACVSVYVEMMNMHRGKHFRTRKSSITKSKERGCALPHILSLRGICIQHTSTHPGCMLSMLWRDFEYCIVYLGGQITSTRFRCSFHFDIFRNFSIPWSNMYV